MRIPLPLSLPLLALAACGPVDPAETLQAADAQIAEMLAPLGAYFAPPPAPAPQADRVAGMIGAMRTGGEHFSGALTQHAAGHGTLSFVTSSGAACTGAMAARALRELSGPLHCDDGRSGLFVIDPKNLAEPGAGRLGDRAFAFRLVRRDGDPAAPLLH